MAGFSGADPDGLLVLARALARSAGELEIHRLRVALLLDRAGAPSDAVRTLAAIEQWCLTRRDDVVRRLLILEANDGPLGWLVDRAVTPVIVKDLLGARGALRGFDRALGPIGIVANLETIADPPHDGWRGVLDQAIATVGATAGTVVVAGGVAAAAEMSPAWATGAVAAASAYVAGSWLYDNRKPIVETLEDAADAVDAVDPVDLAIDITVELVEDGTRAVCRMIPTTLKTIPPIPGFDGIEICR